ncbi:putative GMC oxidoreductase [Coleophoma crateriformis]|uniref:Putative GMC oxidoreductase n=1 Tax=Coleophoma crateriformis TaxID=565419 RepID=A0A3D8SGR7_9HELO|nr:putative GMC oxidoreductase [Coleophoma crateriformis]
MFVLRTLTFFAIAASLVSSSPAPKVQKRATDVTELEDYDYIVVGSGAGGGPLAARLAINGQKVLLLEAGDDEGSAVQQSIPAFFPAASEYEPMSWDFFVRHYPNDTREALNSKATYELTDGSTYIGLDPPAGATLKGIWYPRTGTLGGCGAHNALVTIYPHERDWTLIQTLTGDDTWAPENMRQYFERLEHNNYMNASSTEAGGHGFDGWLGTDEMSYDLILEDPQIREMLRAASSVVDGSPTANITTDADLDALFPLDINTNYTNRDSTVSLYQLPMSVTDGVRISPRDFLIATADATFSNGTKMYQLDIRTNAFVTNIRFSDDAVPVALGVDFLDGQYLYKASPLSGSTTGTPGSVNATKEVIIAAGTFNTPQLLKLSGVGPAAELESFNISVVADLPGVGANLQDHYEISTTVEYDTDFTLLQNCTFLSTTDDACYLQYAANDGDAKGIYATNLIPAAGLLKSSIATTEHDTFTFGGPINFYGYFQGYTDVAIADTKHWTWLTLKAHEQNLAGTVTLTSTDPLEMPSINFNYFDAGTTTDGVDVSDLQPMIDGIKWSREVYGNISSEYSFTEILPGADTVTDAEIGDFVKDNAWGHHATGTARMGSSSDVDAVVDSHFRVFNVANLRIVDASIFPQVPGFFPVTSVYMISEKAADVILADNA